MIRSLSVSKYHGLDNISIRMLKICDSAIVEPVSIILNTWRTKECFLIFGKDRISAHSTRKVTNKKSAITY